MFESFFNAIFGSLVAWSPLGGLLVVCFVLTLIITLAYKFLTNQELMKSLKAEIKGFQQQMKEHKENPSKVMEIQKQAMERNMKYMMHSFKPTIFTFIPLIIIFTWLRTTYSTIELPFLSWFWIYVLASLAFSMILRKTFKIH